MLPARNARAAFCVMLVCANGEGGVGRAAP